MNPRYITTAIPFVNAEPHVGFAYELLLADVLARHARSRGSDVRLQSGTDENSLKNVRAAERDGVPVQELVRKNAAAFFQLAGILDISLDDFLRTSTDPRHGPGVHKLWRACASVGDVYRSLYRGFYCGGCEAFFAEGERCSEHEAPLELIEEENWFFRLSRYQEQLRSLIDSGRLRIEPASRKQETLALLAHGLNDISISRSKRRSHGWGIGVPGDPDQITYVWFDALGNYLTALDYARDGDDYRKYWNGSAKRVHVIGKGITRFHALYWPAFLLSARLPVPDVLFVHGYLTVEGRKISKSTGTAKSPTEVVKRYGVDAVRYYLLSQFRPADDGDFCESRIVGCYEAELANRIGNLVRRVVTLVHKKCSGRVQAPSTCEPIDEALREEATGLARRVDEAMAGFEIHEALGSVSALFDAANRYVDATAPWNLQGARLSAVLYRLIHAARIGAAELAPFLPRASQAILEQLGTGELVPGGPVLFPKSRLDRSAQSG